MPNWQTPAEARNDLRRFLNDGPLDRPVKNKQVVGIVDGSNKEFMTWDDRVVPDSLVATVNFEPVAVATFDDPIMGVFTLESAPAAQKVVRARYYFQFFLDGDLDEALKMAAGELHETDDITSVQPGLKNSALNFGGHFAFQKQAIRWAQRMSARFLLEEEPVTQETEQRGNHFLQIAREYWKQGTQGRDSFYMRHGRRNAPASSMWKPRIPPLAPRR
jgi:hypothetical protein